MSTKKLPPGVLTINERFRHVVDSFFTKWPASKGAKPEDVEDARRIATLAFASAFQNTSAFDWLRRPFPVARGVVIPASEPRSAIEHWLVLFLKFPDFAIELLRRVRVFAKKYDAVDIALFRASLAGTLDKTSDGELLTQIRNSPDGRALTELSENAIADRRKAWTHAQKKSAEDARPRVWTPDKGWRHAD